jgi:hypothetical protein
MKLELILIEEVALDPVAMIEPKLAVEFVRLPH